MQSIKLLLIIFGLSFLGCGGDNRVSSDSNLTDIETPTVETLEEPKTFDISSMSGTIGKIEIPMKKNDIIKNVELVGSGSEKFKISSDGTLSIKSNTKLLKFFLSKTVIKKVIYNFRVKITYNSGKILYIKLKITLYRYIEIVDNITDTNSTANTSNQIDTNSTANNRYK